MAGGGEIKLWVLNISNCFISNQCTHNKWMYLAGAKSLIYEKPNYLATNCMYSNIFLHNHLIPINIKYLIILFVLWKASSLVGY